MGYGADALCFVFFGNSYPHHLMAAVFHDYPAYLVQIRGFVRGARHCLAALAQRRQCSVQSVEFFLLFFALGNVQECGHD